MYVSMYVCTHVCMSACVYISVCAICLNVFGGPLIFIQRVAWSALGQGPIQSKFAAKKSLRNSVPYSVIIITGRSNKLRRVHFLITPYTKNDKWPPYFCFFKYGGFFGEARTKLKSERFVYTRSECLKNKAKTKTSVTSVPRISCTRNANFDVLSSFKQIPPEACFWRAARGAAGASSAPKSCISACVYGLTWHFHGTYAYTYTHAYAYTGTRACTQTWT